MLTKGIIGARFNVRSNMLVCVVSRYNYCMVYYIVILLTYNSYLIYNKYTTRHCLSCIEGVSI